MIDYFLGAAKHEPSSLRSSRRRPNPPIKHSRSSKPVVCLFIGTPSHLVQALRPASVPAVPHSVELSTEKELERVQKFSSVRG
jgi:hypothetical protein